MKLLSQITVDMNEMLKIMEKNIKKKIRISFWEHRPNEPYQRIIEQLLEDPSSTKTEWVVVDYIEETNKIELFWDELKLFLEDDEDFQILQINYDSIKIKALNPMAFRKEYVYCRILSNIIPSNCNLELKSSYFQADAPENDFMVFDLSINTESNLIYKGQIKIIK